MLQFSTSCSLFKKSGSTALVFFLESSEPSREIGASTYSYYSRSPINNGLSSVTRLPHTSYIVLCTVLLRVFTVTNFDRLSQPTKHQTPSSIVVVRGIYLKLHVVANRRYVCVEVLESIYSMLTMVTIRRLATSVGRYLHRRLAAQQQPIPPEALPPGHHIARYSRKQGMLMPVELIRGLSTLSVLYETQHDKRVRFAPQLTDSGYCCLVLVSDGNGVSFTPKEYASSWSISAYPLHFCRRSGKFLTLLFFSF
jgi:hypothetical protein